MQPQTLPERLSDSDRKGTGTMLDALLADQLALGARMRNCRWNVPGLSSDALHRLFESHTAVLDGILDAMAEQARAMENGGTAALAAFLKLTRSKAQPGEQPPATQITAELLAGHEAVLDRLRGNLDACAGHCGDFGTVDLLNDLMEKHENMAGDLRDVLQGKPPATDPWKSIGP